MLLHNRLQKTLAAGVAAFLVAGSVAAGGQSVAWAEDPAPTAPPVVEAAVAAATTDGLTLHTTGSGLPSDVTSVYAALVDSEHIDAVTSGSSDPANFAHFVNPNNAFLEVADGAFETDFLVPVANLNRSLNYEFLVWQKETAYSDTTSYARVPVTVDSASWDAVFGKADPADPKDPKDPADPKDPKDPADPKDPKDPKDPADPEKTAIGELRWGVKESFRKYIWGGIAHGSITVVEPAKSEFLPEAEGKSEDEKKPFQIYVFPQVDKQAWNKDNSTGSVSYAGGIKFYGHEGMLDVSLYNPKVTVSDQNTALLEAALTPKGDLLKVINIDLSQATKETDDAGLVTYKNAPTSVHKDASDPVFAGFYDPGTKLDDITFSIGKSSDVKVDPSKDDDPKTPVKPPKPPKPPVKPETPRRVVSSNAEPGSLTWGISTSFGRYVSEGYVKGRATPVNTGGRVTGNGVRGGLGGYIFAQTTSNFNPKTETGTLQYSGVVNYWAHKGMLNQSFANPSIKVLNSSRAEMYANGVLWGYIDLTTARKTRTAAGAVTWTGATFIPGPGARAFLNSSFDKEGKIQYDSTLNFTAGGNGVPSSSGIITAGNTKSAAALAAEKQQAANKAKQKAKEKELAKALAEAKKRGAKKTKQPQEMAAAAQGGTTDVPEWAWWSGAGVLTLVAGVLGTLVVRQRRVL